MKKTLLILILFLSVQLSFSQEMITNFISEEKDQSSNPASFIEFNQKIFFTATTEEHGYEIWMTDGNKDETVLLKDINIGQKSGINGSLPEVSAIIDDTLFFIATDGNSNGEIWKTDGTTSGTVKVTSFLNANISKLTLVGEKIYFLTKEDDLLQVWTTDGTELGTKIIKEDLPIWNTPSFQGKCNNTFIFTFQPYNSNNSKVWRSDGTSEGTFPITEEIDGIGLNSSTSRLSQYIEYNNELYFISRHFLHKTDGTLENTVSINSLNYSSSGLTNYADVIKANGKLYFSFFQRENNHLSIWEFDTQNLQANLIYDVISGFYFVPSNLIEKENNLFFSSVNSAGGTSLCSLNLSDYSLVNIKEIETNSESPFSSRRIIELKKINENKLYLRNNTEFWLSEFTPETTNKIFDLRYISDILNFNNSLYFSKRSDLEGVELWRSNTDLNDFYLLKNINKSRNGLEENTLLKVNSKLIFYANDGTDVDKLWNYTGSINPIKSISPNLNSAIELNNNFYFTAYNSNYGNEIWKTDGTEQGTVIAHDIIEGASSSWPQLLTAHKEKFYFTIFNNGGYNFCKSDGLNFEIIMNTEEIENLISSGDYLYFTSLNNGYKLYVSDGTEIGTSVIQSINAFGNQFKDVNGSLFYTALSTEHLGEYELYKTNGTSESTALVKNIETDFSSDPSNFFNNNGSLYFTAETSTGGRELWISDGTENSTFQIKDINQGNKSSVIYSNEQIMESLSGEVYFSADDGIHGTELWKTDGTEEGTVLLSDINTGSDSSNPNYLKRIGNEIYFQAYDKSHGNELWKTDGTEEGTVLVSDIIPGETSSYPFNFINIDSDLFFIAYTKSYGKQIWKLEENSILSIKEIKPTTDNHFLYPNPSHDFITIKSSDDISNIKIYNINGQIENSPTKVTNGKINIYTLKKGMHLIKYEINGTSFVKKFIKI